MATGIFPAIQPEPLDGGLLSAANVVSYDGTDPWWSAGQFTWDTWMCPSDLVLTDLCNGGKSGTIAGSDYAPGVGWPFGIVMKHQCYASGSTAAARKGLLSLQMEAATSKSLERELQTGEAVLSGGHFDTHYLTDADTTKVTTAAVSVALGIASLEQALADCGIGPRGVIHMPRALASLAALNGSLFDIKGKLFTALGTSVVSGAGYTVKAPLSVPAAARPTAAVTPTKIVPEPLPTTAWMYATGPVAVHLATMDVLDEHLDRPSNILTVMVARTAAVYFDSCCHFAAEVKLA
jgi:hypothetical protein